MVFFTFTDVSFTTQQTCCNQVFDGSFERKTRGRLLHLQ